MFTFFTAVTVLAGIVAAAPVSEVQPSALEKRTTHWGQATYFYDGLGACGWENQNNDKIVALNSAQYEENGGANCGQWLSITNTDNGKTVDAYVADECPTCDYGSLDMSTGLFGALSNDNFNEGVFPIKWHFHAKN